MHIYPGVKQAPLQGLTGMGGGVGSNLVVAGASGLVGSGLGFADSNQSGGYDFVGLWTGFGTTKKSSTNVSIAHSTGSDPSYDGGILLTGVDSPSSQNIEYDVTNPLLHYAQRSWAGGSSANSWTTVEKIWMASGSSFGNRGFSDVRVEVSGNNKWVHLARHDNRGNGSASDCIASYGTTYPYITGQDSSANSNQDYPLCSAGYDGWWVNLGSWDDSTNKYWWARSDTNDSDGEIIYVNSASSYPSDTQAWRSYASGNTSDPCRMAMRYTSSGQEAKYADLFIIYGKAINTLAEAQKYNLLSRTHHIDPYNA